MPPRPTVLRLLTIIAMMLSSVAAFGAAPAPAPSTQPTLQTLKQEEFGRQILEKAAIINAKSMNLSDLVHVRLHDGRLTADASLKSDDWIRVGLGNPLQLCTMREPAPDFLQFMLDDFTDPTNIYVQTEILAAPGQLQIVGSWEFPGRERFVTLIEKYAGLDEEGRNAPGQTRLLVQEMSDDNGETINLTLTEPDWATLLRKHPREMRTYFRPVLRELRAQALFQPDPHVEWQIFGLRAQPEAPAEAAVQKWLPLLDSESFSQRQHALHQLTALGTPGAIALMHMDQHSLSTEQSARIADILYPYERLSPKETAALSRQPEFLLDCMDSDDAQLRELASAQLAKVIKRSIKFDAQADESARQSQLSQLRHALLAEH